MLLLPRLTAPRIVLMAVLGFLVFAVDVSAATAPAGQVLRRSTPLAPALPTHAAPLSSRTTEQPRARAAARRRHHDRRRVGDVDVQTRSIDVGFDMDLVAQRAQELSTHSWEYGTTAELLLELYTPRLSAFNPFPQGAVPQGTSIASTPALAYIAPKIYTNNSDTLMNGAGSSGDPCALGVSAILLAHSAPNGSYASPKAYKAAYRRQVRHLLDDVPHYPSGAISSREQGLEMWADFTYMAFPFMAYSAAAANNLTRLKDTVKQLQLYQDELAWNPRANLGAHPELAGIWQHIMGGGDQSAGLWTTGNVWALNGLVRVLAVLKNWPGASSLSWEAAQVEGMINSILNPIVTCTAKGPRYCPMIDRTTGLLKGYLVGGPQGPSQQRPMWPGDVAGSAGIASTIYRMAQLGVGNNTHLDLARQIRTTIATKGHIDARGYVAPAMNPYNWNSPVPYAHSPEGQAFVALMGTAYRGCVHTKACSQ